MLNILSLFHNTSVVYTMMYVYILSDLNILNGLAFLYVCIIYCLLHTFCMYAY